MPFLFEKGERPKIEKRGNKVLVLRTRFGISFRDVCKLLSPSTNLRSFGKLFNLEDEKAHFPFKFLDSVEKLNFPGLPEDPEIWKSDLSGGSVVSPEVIAQARQMFVDAGCETLGDYLKTYLKKDVVILYLATQEWRKQLDLLIGVDFIMSRKFTISSLAHFACQRNHVANKEVGTFFCNNFQTYELLRNGMRG